MDVTIHERAPLGIGRIHGALYLVDDRGTVIDHYGPAYADLDLPIIDGLSSAPGEETADAYRAMLARRLLDSLRGRNVAGHISQIDVSDARNAVVLLDGDPTLIRLGHERFVERLQSYFELGRPCASACPQSTTWICDSTSGCMSGPPRNERRRARRPFRRRRQRRAARGTQTG